MGAKGFRVEDYRDVPEVEREAVTSNRPCVINAVIEGGEKVLAEPFRWDALKHRCAICRNIGTYHMIKKRILTSDAFYLIIKTSCEPL